MFTDAEVDYLITQFEEAELELAMAERIMAEEQFETPEEPDVEIDVVDSGFIIKTRRIA